MSQNDEEFLKISGLVKKGSVSVGSKGEHIAYIIEYKDSYLRLAQKGKGGFGNNYFEKFLNKIVKIEGVIVKKVLFVEKIAILPV